VALRRAAGGELRRGAHGTRGSGGTGWRAASAEPDLSVLGQSPTARWKSSATDEVEGDAIADGRCAHLLAERASASRVGLARLAQRADSRAGSPGLVGLGAIPPRRRRTGISSVPGRRTLPARYRPRSTAAGLRWHNISACARLEGGLWGEAWARLQPWKELAAPRQGPTPPARSAILQALTGLCRPAQARPVAAQPSAGGAVENQSRRAFGDRQRRDRRNASLSPAKMGWTDCVLLERRERPRARPGMPPAACSR
jgi:hypothetical protein